MKKSVVDIRLAAAGDLDALLLLEKRCFSPARRSDARSIRRGLRGTRQAVWVATDSCGTIVGALFLWYYQHVTRIYSVAVHPDYRHAGIGKRFLDTAMREAHTRGHRTVSLEVDAADARLVSWYENVGFQRIHLLPDYYEPGQSAYRMRCAVSGVPHRSLEESCNGEA